MGDPCEILSGDFSWISKDLLTSLVSVVSMATSMAKPDQ